jgi:hypothetical protein
MMARTEADRVRPMDDISPIRDFPKYNRPLVQVGSIFGKALGWSGSYGLIGWLDASEKYHLAWAQPDSIKRVAHELWKGSRGL